MKARWFFCSVGLAAAVMAGCASLVVPQNAEEFRATMRPYVEKSEVKRPFRTVSDVLSKKAAECLDVTVSRQYVVYNGPIQSNATVKVKYRPAVKVSQAKTELVLRIDDGKRGGPNKFPEGGEYFYILDAYPSGSDRTKLEIYATRGGIYKTVIPDAISGWINGTSGACPKLP